MCLKHFAFGLACIGTRGMNVSDVKSEPYWWEDGGAPASPPLCDLPEEAGVVVIGAGLTGLTAALTLARRGKHVVVLDAGAPGIGASSRNGGMVGGGHRLSIDEMEASMGSTLR